MGEVYSGRNIIRKHPPSTTLDEKVPRYTSDLYCSVFSCPVTQGKGNANQVPMCNTVSLCSSRLYGNAFGPVLGVGVAPGQIHDSRATATLLQGEIVWELSDTLSYLQNLYLRLLPSANNTKCFRLPFRNKNNSSLEQMHFSCITFTPFER